MAWKEKGGYTSLLYLGLFVILSSFCRGAEQTRIKASNPSIALKLKFRENSTLINGQVNGATSSDVHHGRLIIGRNSRQGAIKERKSANNSLNVNADYQSDMGWEKPVAFHGTARPDSGTVEQLLQMEPEVECTGHSMKLKVHDSDSFPGSLIFVDRGSRLSPLPLSKLTPSCGYTMRSTRKDFVLVAPYDGCFVTQEEDNYVLPLRWCGLQVRMSCPVMKPSSPNPPMVTCHAEGMVVKMEWAGSVKDIKDIKVNISGQWEPLMKVSPKCGFGVVAHPEGVVVSARYAPCVEMKDGMFTLELTGEGEIHISCPSQLVPNPDEPHYPKPTQSPTKSSNQQMDKVVYPSHPWSPHFVPPTLAPHKNPMSLPYTPYPQALVDDPRYPEYLSNWPPPTNQRPKDIHHPPQQPKKPGKPESPLGPKPTPAVQPPAPHVPDSQQPQQSTVSPVEKSTAPDGRVHQPFYPYPFYPWPLQPKQPNQKAPGKWPQTTQPPNSQVKQPFYPYPFYTQPAKPETSPSKPTPPPVTQAPKGQVEQPFYPYPFYHWSFKPDTPALPAQKPVLQPTPASVTQAPKVQVEQPLDPYPYYPPPPKHETALTKPPASMTPPGQGYFYQYPVYPPYEHETHPQKPEPPTKPPSNQTPNGKGQQPFNPLYPNPPENPLPGILPPAPGGREQQPFHPNPFYPQPSKPDASASPVEKPPSNTFVLPQVTQAPKGQVLQPFYPYPFYTPPAELKTPFTKKTVSVTQLPTTEAPKGQAHYPYPFYPKWPHNPEHVPNQPAKKPASVTQPPASEVPKGQVYQPFYPYPFYPQQPQFPEFVTKPPQLPTKKPAPATQAPKGQVHHPFYPYPFYPQQPQIPKPVMNPLIPSAIKPGATTQLKATEAPTHPVHPTTPLGPVLQKPDGTTVPPSNKWSQKPANPQLSKPNVPAMPEPVVFPQAPQPGTPYNPSVHCPQFCPSGHSNCCPPISFHQPSKPNVPAMPEPIMLPQGPQPGTPSNPFIHCPQFCPLGFSNCCPPISFHQHHHHIVPAGMKGDGILPIYPGFPFLPISGYSIFGYGKESASSPISAPSEATTSAPPEQSEATPAPPQPTEGSTTTAEVKTAPPDSSQKGFGGYWSHIASPSLPFGSQPEMQQYLQPGSHPIAPPVSDPNKPIHPFMYYNSQYPKWPYEQVAGEEHSRPSRTQPPADGPPKHLMGQPQAFSYKHAKLQAPVSDPMLPYYQVYDFQPLMPHGQPSSGDEKNPSEPEPSLQPYFMPYVPQNPQHPNDPRENQQLPAMEPQPPAKGLSEPEHPLHQDESELFYPPLVPYHMLHDSQPQVPPYSKSSSSKPDQPSKPQLPVGDSKPSKTEINSPMRQYFQPNGYVLLQHGPPGSEPNRSPESQLPATDPNVSSGPQPSMPVYDPNMFLAPKPQWHGNGKLQNHEGLQGKPQPLKHLGTKGMYGNLLNDGASITTEGYGLPLYYPAPSNPPHKSLKPEFPESLKDYWKPIMLSGSSYRIPPPYPGLPSKGQDSAIDHQPKGHMYRPIQRNNGHQKLNQS